jgi:hypothetical protein
MHRHVDRYVPMHVFMHTSFLEFQIGDIYSCVANHDNCGKQQKELNLLNFQVTNLILFICLPD